MDASSHLGPAPSRQQLERTGSRGSGSATAMGVSAQIRDAKGLALELKDMIKRREPWERNLEFQRESLRKAYLRIVFSPAFTQAKSTSLNERGSTADAPSSSPSHTARPSTATAGVSSAVARQQLDILNLLWLDTSHALIQAYRARLAALDKQLAAAPKAHKGKSRNGGGGGAGGGDVQLATVGPVARRKLVHSFRQFLGKEEDFWRTLCGRLASRLLPEEAQELRAVGITRSDFFSTSDGERGDSFAALGSAAGAGAPEIGEEEQRARRAAVLPLAHKALICFGDLARYSELYNEASVPAAVRGAGKKEGGKRGGARAQGGGPEKRVKNYSRAAECYNQARLLLPDNGNPSNQLAVLAQYSSDPMSSIYHYYRALSVRTPFTTARANLQVTFSKALIRWFSTDGGEPDGDEGDKFKAAFIVLQGILFTKEKVAELPTLSLRVQDLFHTVLVERAFTSDVVIRIVVTSLSAVWDARISRSASHSSLLRTKTGSTSAVTARPTEQPSAERVNLEPEALVHLLSLFTLLLRVSAGETVDLYSTNAAAATASAPLIPSQNISAVLRRSLPALRILTRWLVAQLDYIQRVTARVEASERKRASRGRTSLGTPPADGEDAQQPLSLESSASRGSVAAGRVTLAELQSALDALWSAFADYANAIKLAFPMDALPVALLDEGGWLEEDVELLGFAPLRRALRPHAEDEAGARIRRVGRDLHPNDEQLMRVADGQRAAIALAESPLTRISLQDGAYVFVQRPSQQENASPEAAAAGLDDEDNEMVYQTTEDDPVDRAMRIDTADKLEMDGLSEADDVAEEDDDDDDDEQIVYPGSRSSSQPPVPLSSAHASRSPSYFGTPSASPARPAVDFRQHIFQGHSHSSMVQPPPPMAAPHISPSSSHIGPALVAPNSIGGSPSLNPVHSIWTPTPGLAGSPLLPSTGGSLPPPSTYALPQQQQQPVTPHSFESIPNLTHGSPAANLAGWPTGLGVSSPHGTLPPPGPGATGGAALYGGAFASRPTHPLQHAQPYPNHPAVGNGSPALGGPSGLSPFAPPYGRAPAPPGTRDGWPSGYS